MSQPSVSPSPPESTTSSRRGQSLVEFALVLPMLLVLLLGIADFGRVFQAGITLETAARNAAEIAAETYEDNPPGPLTSPAPLPADVDYYKGLHHTAATTACDEIRVLPNAGYDAATQTCSGLFVLVCVHDQADPLCNTAPDGFPSNGAIAGCPRSSSAALDASQPPESPDLRYVEVRVCYRFTTLFNLTDLHFPFGGDLNLGAISLEKTRTFTVADW